MADIFNIAILGSTRGSNLPGLATGLENKPIRITGVISNKNDTGILEKARQLNLNSIFIDSKKIDFEKRLDAHLHENTIDLLVLMGFMKILSPWFVNRWKNKVINVHPSLLPKYAGLMNLAVHQAVLDHHDTETGCTVHWVTNEVDAGDVIIQKKCGVFSTDTAEILKQRVQTLEVQALIEAIHKVSATQT